MSLMSWFLASVLTLDSASAGQAGPTKCEPTDNRCKAELFVRRAKEAKNDEQRALYFNVAHRSYLALFDKTGDMRHLCAARRMYDKSVAIKDQPVDQRESFKALLGDLTTRERKAGGRCEKTPMRPQDDAPLLAAKTRPATATSTSSDETPAANTSAEFSTSETAANRSTETTAAPTTADSPRPASAVASLDPAQVSRVSDDGLLPVSPRPRPLSSTTTAPRPGRGLMIAGGVALACSLSLAGVATYTGAGLLETRREARALHDMVDGYATDQQLAQDAALWRDYQRQGAQTLALAVASGTMMVVGAVLLGVGGRRLARAPSQTALLPVLGGVAFRARF